MRMKPSTSRKPRALVIGCGISGLTCGARLLEEGFDTTIIARELPPHTTSDAAAAVWFPYSVRSERLERWGQISFARFSQLAGVAGAGVSFTRLAMLFKRHEGEAKFNELKSVGLDFVRMPGDAVPRGYEGGYELAVPLIEPQLYLPHLMNDVRERGGRIERGEVRDLSDVGAHEVLVNCAGAWAGGLAGDRQVYPIRGQVVRVSKAAGVGRCLVDDNAGRELTYIFPRSTDCILGGTAEKGDWNLNVAPAAARAILDRCAGLVSAIRGAEILEHKVGLRPGREQGVRLQAERVPGGGVVIHNYGHGGSGFTISWGCADEVAELAKACVAA